ncbi:hypothetical protein NT6N_30240 [Oceaniferula spumae]|uniref:Pectate lyase superfamily protein domain-containing protein n=1 Tax=Oceaniferula spumae TaxID=2979115 RepID=A0AAT9FQ15_9BACT
MHLYHKFQLLALVSTVLCTLPLHADAESDVRKKAVHYEDFGAKGDGKTDDSAAIRKAHAHANHHGLPVRANDQAVYYIGDQDQPAQIQTNTHFGTARFIIDDRAIKNHRVPVFLVPSTQKPVPLPKITKLTRHQKRLAISLPSDCIVHVSNRRVKHYIRKGLNPNKGKDQSDVFLVRKNGLIDPDTPILWDFDHISRIRATPIDTSPLTISGGHFTTIANNEKSEYDYYARGITIQRSNVTLQGINHLITGEGDHGAPYHGFVNIRECANVTVLDCSLSGHKTYRTIGRADKPVSMGSYDITVTRAINVSFINCKQLNDIKDSSRWGIMASNYCKNLSYDGCTLSRFDAHMGVAGAVIKNSTLGHAGLNAIGHGTLTVENSTIYGRNLVNLRSDYGSNWRGEFIIRNCKFIPACGKPISPSLIGGHNDGSHDFGYPCHMPAKITIHNLHIDDSQHPNNYKGPSIFANFNPNFTSNQGAQKHPYTLTKEVVLENITTASGLPLRVSDNTSMFKNVSVQEKQNK